MGCSHIGGGRGGGRAQSNIGAESKGLRGQRWKAEGGWHGSRVTSGSLQPDSCFYPKLNKVSSLTQQVLLEDVP